MIPEPPPLRKKGIPLEIKKRLQASALFAAAALVCAPVASLSLPMMTGQESGAKQDLKAAGHDSKAAVKDVGHGVATGTKKAYYGTIPAARKVVHKMKDTTAGAAEGAKDGAKKP
jgi:hypothetical protein